MARRKTGARKAAPRGPVTVRDVAEKVRQPAELVRDVLNEAAGVRAPRRVQDRIFEAARTLGYDLRKLKIGKRMQHRKDTLTEVLLTCRAHPEWGQKEIVAYLERSLQMLDRVRRKVFEQEFGDAWL
jgi:DNA-binding LacI/PurR family transcriptional regulator